MTQSWTSPRFYSPEVLPATRALAEVVDVIKADKTIWTIIASQRWQKTGCLAFVTLALIIWKQLKRLSLCFSDSLGQQRKIDERLDHSQLILPSDNVHLPSQPTLSRRAFRNLRSSCTKINISLCTAAAKFKSNFSGQAAILQISSSWEKTQ